MQKICKCIYLYIYIYIYTHTHTHTYISITHVYIRTSVAARVLADAAKARPLNAPHFALCEQLPRAPRGNYCGSVLRPLADVLDEEVLLLVRHAGLRCVCVRVCGMCVLVFFCGCVCMNECMYVCIYVCMHVYTYIHIYIYIYIYIL